MEKNVEIKDIKLFEDSLINRPCQKHDEDHIAIRSSFRILLNIVKQLEERLQWSENVRAEDGTSLADLNDRINDTNRFAWRLDNNIKNLAMLVTNMVDNYPTITTMQKNALLIDGENVIDTVKLESWRYLMVKSITPTDWNEYAKLDKTFSREQIEITDGQYDVKVDLNTNTEWETATMTVNIDLLFIKY